MPDATQSIRSTFIEEILFRSWWMVIFILIAYAAYEHGLYQSRQEFDKLTAQVQSLQKEKERELKIQNDLKMKIQSQNDPAWIELTLMRRVGLVPKDQTKVYFYRDNKE